MGSWFKGLGFWDFPEKRVGESVSGYCEEKIRGHSECQRKCEKKCGHA